MDTFLKRFHSTNQPDVFTVCKKNAWNLFHITIFKPKTLKLVFVVSMLSRQH